jgi:hypothetical protein
MYFTVEKYGSEGVKIPSYENLFFTHGHEVRGDNYEECVN